MADRCTLHIKHLDAFASFLSARGFYPLPLTNCYERLRMRNGKQLVVVYKKDSATQHLTVQNKAFPLVRAFYRSRKEDPHAPTH